MQALFPALHIHELFSSMQTPDDMGSITLFIYQLIRLKHCRVRQYSQGHMQLVSIGAGL